VFGATGGERTLRTCWAVERFPRIPRCTVRTDLRSVFVSGAGFCLTPSDKRATSRHPGAALWTLLFCKITSTTHWAADDELQFLAKSAGPTVVTFWGFFFPPGFTPLGFLDVGVWRAFAIRLISIFFEESSSWVIICVGCSVILHEVVLLNARTHSSFSFESDFELKASSGRGRKGLAPYAIGFVTPPTPPPTHWGTDESSTDSGAPGAFPSPGTERLHKGGKTDHRARYALEMNGIK